MKALKIFTRKILNCVSPGLEQQMVNQYHFDRDKRKGSGLSWQALRPGPEKRLDAGGVQVGHRLYVFGGLFSRGGVSSKLDILDLQTQKWAARVDMPAGMQQTHLGMISDGSRYIYSVSGQLGCNCRPPSPACFVFDTHNNSWCDLVPLPEARYAPTVQLWNGRLHAIGGSREDRNTHAMDHWSIAVKDGKALEDRWHVEPSIPRGGPHRSSAIADDALYVFGGQEGDYIAIPGDAEYRCTGDLTNETVYPDVYRLRHGSVHWERMADMPIPVSHTEFATAHFGLKIALLGGQVERNAETKKVQITDAIQIYDFAKNTWTIAGSLPYRTKATVAGYYDGQLYFTTGQRDNEPISPLPAPDFDDSLWRVRFNSNS